MTLTSCVTDDEIVEALGEALGITFEDAEDADDADDDAGAEGEFLPGERRQG